MVAALGASSSVAGLAAGRNWERLRRAGARARRRRRRARRSRGRREAAAELERPGPRRRGGRARADRRDRPDLVLNAIVGTAGLGPTIVALTEGIDLALANKESLVVGGELVTALAEATGAGSCRSTPSTRRSSSCCAASGPGTVERLVLTASGGPFRGRRDLAGVTAEEALAHPTWEMGGRITIDSATLMNKGLEMIEAHHLFGVAYERIDVVVHPQSIVHSLIQLNDGAHARPPRATRTCGCRSPTRCTIPERADVTVPQPRPRRGRRARPSSAPDLETFPCLRLAREAGEAGGTAPCVLNAADEVAVAAFLDGRIPFTGDRRGDRAARSSAAGAEPVDHFEHLFACRRRGARARPASWSRRRADARELVPRLRRLRRR